MKSKLLYIFLVAILMLGGCQGSSQDSQQVYQKRAEVISVSNEPASYRSFALVSSGNIHVGGKLTTDGPLADVHANGAVQARALSLSVSGKITAQNNTTGLAIRSFDYTSNVDNQSFVEIRALKVSEYLNVSLLNEYYLLGADGVATHRVKDSPDLALGSLSSNFIFNNGTWEISGDMLELPIPVVAETDLQITTNNLFIAGTLMVQGNLVANGELNINTGTPFDKALIVDRNIEVNKLVAIGRIHGSGTFTSHGEVNILGNAEIDGDVTLYGDARINFLDNVYKAAISEAQNEILSDPYAVVDAYTEPTLMLVHSQLFSDAQGKNSVVLFTFVEGNYILNENTLFKLIETNQIDEFKFRSYLYGATIDYAAQLQKFGGLSPYYANKLALINKLKSQDNTQVKLTESLDVAPSNLYHSFEDRQGNKLGTYLVYSMGAAFDIDNPQMLTTAQREQVIYNIVHKEEIEAQRELDAKQALVDQKSAILMDTTVDEYTRQLIITNIEGLELQNASTDKVIAKAEAEQNRINEWLNYKNIESSNEEVEVADVVVEQATEARGWFRRFVRRVIRRVFRPVCRVLKSRDFIAGVNNNEAPLFLGVLQYKYDGWSKRIALNNSSNYHCVPISSAMIINYQLYKRGKPLLYSGDRNSLARVKASSYNPLVLELASAMGTTSSGTATPPSTGYLLARTMTNKGVSSSGYTTYYNRYNKNYHFDKRWGIKHAINTNNPLMFTTNETAARYWWFFPIKHHAMPVIGYKKDRLVGFCRSWYKERRWLYVDLNRMYPLPTWLSSMTNIRMYIRFDNYSNYRNTGSLTYVWPN